MMKPRGILTLGALAAFAFVAPAGQAYDFYWPVSGRVTSNYYSPRPYGYHGAIDIAGSYWSPVGASRYGYVSYRGWYGSYGNLVIVKHQSGYSTYYAHNIAFGRSGSVSRMTTISYRGSTGHSTGPHVHFEIRRWGGKRYIPAALWSWKTKGYGVPYDYAGI